ASLTDRHRAEPVEEPLYYLVSPASPTAVVARGLIRRATPVAPRRSLHETGERKFIDRVMSLPGARSVPCQTARARFHERHHQRGPAGVRPLAATTCVSAPHDPDRLS